MKSEVINKVKSIYYHLLVPVIIFYAMEWFLRNPFHEKWGIKPSLVIINLIFFYLFEIFFYAFFGSLRFSLYLLSISAFLTGLANYYICEFRGNTIVPWDFLSIKTAASVADNYDYTPGIRVIFVIALFILVWISIFYCSHFLGKRFFLRLILAAGSLLFFFTVYVPLVQSENTIKSLKVYDKLFTPATMTMKDGTVFAFIYDMQFMDVSKPDGYYASEIFDTLYNEYKGNKKKQKTDENTPNIIVIMCEAFSDPAVCTEFTTSEDFMPFIRSLMEGDNVFSGNLHVSVKGGNTPNTEFEYLTGNSMAFLPSGSIPFQQFVRKRMDSMPYYLNDIGYRTIAMHPYKSTGWCRNEAYPCLGFEEMYFLDYFEHRNPEYIRKYISDETLFFRLP